MAKEWPTFPAPAKVNTDVLRSEVEAAGFRRVQVALVESDVRVVGRRGDDSEIDDDDRATLAPIVAAHTGATPVEDDRRVKAAAKISNAIATLENADANWASLTAAQKDTATRLVVRVVAKLGRFLISKFDVPE